MIDNEEQLQSSSQKDVEHQLFFSFTIKWTSNIYLFLEGYFLFLNMV